jgi:hypothetical protein
MVQRGVDRQNERKPRHPSPHPPRPKKINRIPITSALPSLPLPLPWNQPNLTTPGINTHKRDLFAPGVRVAALDAVEFLHQADRHIGYFCEGEIFCLPEEGREVSWGGFLWMGMVGKGGRNFDWAERVD